MEVKQEQLKRLLKESGGILKGIEVKQQQYKAVTYYFSKY